MTDTYTILPETLYFRSRSTMWNQKPHSTSYSPYWHVASDIIADGKNDASCQRDLIIMHVSAASSITQGDGLTIIFSIYIYMPVCSPCHLRNQLW